MTAWAAIDPDGPSLAIGCALAEHHLCLQIPGMNYRKADQIWRAPLSWPAYVAFRAVWSSQPVTEHPRLAEWAAGQWARVQDAYRMRAALEAPPEVLAPIVLIEHGQAGSDDPHLLYPFQRAGAAWLARMGRVALTDPQGNGKTPQVIRALQIRQKMHGDALPALIICAGAALYSWRDELARWASELSVRVVTGTALKRRQALEGDDPLDIADVYLIAWPVLRYHTRLAAYPGQAFVRCPECGGQDEKITPARCETHEKELNAIKLGTVVADEAHRMKDPHSKQTRAVWHLAHTANCFWPVTGTPIGDTISDLWPVLHGIDPRAFPARSRYLALYAIREYTWHGGMEVLDIRPDTAASWHASVQPLMRRIPKEVARPQMPPRLPPVYRYPEMTPAQAKLYKTIRKELMADLEGSGTLIPPNALVRFTRLCQLAGAMIELTEAEDAAGFPDQQVRLVLPSSKADDLTDFLSDNPGPLVVAVNSPALVELCERKLTGLKEKITSVKITGGMTAEQQYEAARQFQDGQVRVIFITRAGAESITLTASDTVLFLQPQPSFLAREQVIGRVDRIGQRNPVRVVYSITPGTVEQRLADLGNDREERAGNVTRDADLLRWITGLEVETADVG